MCARLRFGAIERAAQGVAIPGPGLQHGGAAGELREEQFVFRSQQVKGESIDGNARGGQLLRRHAGADVEHDAETDRYTLSAEVDNLLRLSVVEDGEILLLQSAGESPVPVG